MLRHLLVTCLALGACDKQGGNGEQEYIAKELGDLKAALAARDESKVVVDCISVTISQPRMPKSIADEIDRLCHNDAPRLLLENAVKDATDAKAKNPDFPQLHCMQLFAADAFKMIPAHPPKDPTLQKLVDDYTRLCPEQVAKFRAQP
jgi:hypothetical protein